MNPGERRNIYIDVDGVCLRSASSPLTGIEPAPHCFAFLQWAVEFSSTSLADDERRSRTARWNLAGVQARDRLRDAAH